MSTVMSSTAGEFQFIKLEIEDDTGLAWLTLNRPEKLNALHVPAVRELREALRRIAASSAKALLLVAAGRGFCAGADLNLRAFSDAPTAPAKAPAKPDNSMQEAWNPFIEELRSFPKPTLAVVQGPTAGGGVGVALATDITIANRSAYFVLTFTPTLGICPDLGVTWQLVRRIGRGKALPLALLGDRLPAAEAERCGLIWATYEDAELLKRARDMALRLTKLPHQAVRLVRDAVDSGSTNSLPAQLEVERLAQAKLFQDPESKRLMAARSKTFQKCREHLDFPRQCSTRTPPTSMALPEGIESDRRLEEVRQGVKSLHDISDKLGDKLQVPRAKNYLQQLVDCTLPGCWILGAAPTGGQRRPPGEDAMIREYQEEINRLKAELEAAGGVDGEEGHMAMGPLPPRVEKQVEYVDKIVEKIVEREVVIEQGPSPEEVAQMEAQLRQQNEEARLKAEAKRREVEAQRDLAESERLRLLAQIDEQEQEAMQASRVEHQDVTPSSRLTPRITVETAPALLAILDDELDRLSGSNLAALLRRLAKFQQKRLDSSLIAKLQEILPKATKAVQKSSMSPRELCTCFWASAHLADVAPEALNLAKVAGKKIPAKVASLQHQGLSQCFWAAAHLQRTSKKAVQPLQKVLGKVAAAVAKVLPERAVEPGLRRTILY
eukprot:s583_g3.t1